MGTDTEVGKTFVTAQMARGLKHKGVNVGYYKAALSGAYYEEGQLVPGDAREVLEAGDIQAQAIECVSYVFEEAVSPHLAAERLGVKIELQKIKEDYDRLIEKHEFVLVEGSGGVICPIYREGDNLLLLEDIIKELQCQVLLIARAGLGTINHTALSVAYLKSKGIEVQGIILNQYEEGNFMHQDNLRVIEALTGIKVVATVPIMGYKEGVYIDGLC